MTQIIFNDLGQTLNGKTIKSIQVDNNVIDVSWYETDPKKLSELGIVLATAILAFEDIHRNRNIKDILWVSAILHSRESARKKQEKELPLIHISEPTRQAKFSYAVFCLKKKNVIPQGIFG